jgi:hypothetical protein
LFLIRMMSVNFDYFQEIKGPVVKRNILGVSFFFILLKKLFSHLDCS